MKVALAADTGKWLRSRVVSAVVALVSAVGVVALAGPGCSNQGEGQRCSALGENGGNDDCAAGLVCTRKGLLEGAQDDLCCPVTGATLPACKPVGGGTTTTPPSEAGTDDASSDAATGDTSTPDTSTPDASGDADAATSDGSSDAADGE